MESLGKDIIKYQRWVDYDMKRYGKISDKTQAELDKAGLQVIKDQYGNYEVSAGDYKAECSAVDNSKKTIFEALTEEDEKFLSELSLTEEEIGYILSLFELISDENSTKAFDIIKALFEGKKLVPDDDEVEENLNPQVKRNLVSENYTRRLLGDN